MEHCTKKPGNEKEIPEFGPDSIEVAMRARIRDTIEAFVEEELDAALGARKSARVGDNRHGYRTWQAGAEADDQSGPDDARDAAGARPADRRDKHRMAGRHGAPI